MSSDYLPANNDSPEIMRVTLEYCSAIQIQIGNT